MFAFIYIIARGVKRLGGKGKGKGERARPEINGSRGEGLGARKGNWQKMRRGG